MSSFVMVMEDGGDDILAFEEGYVSAQECAAEILLSGEVDHLVFYHVETVAHMHREEDGTIHSDLDWENDFQPPKGMVIANENVLRPRRRRASPPPVEPVED